MFLSISKVSTLRLQLFILDFLGGDWLVFCYLESLSDCYKGTCYCLDYQNENGVESRLISEFLNLILYIYIYIYIYMNFIYLFILYNFIYESEGSRFKPHQQGIKQKVFPWTVSSKFGNSKTHKKNSLFQKGKFLLQIIILWKIWQH